MSNDPTKPSTDEPGLEATTKKGISQKVVSLIAIVRARMRDFPELNRLIEGHETSDREIALAMMEAIDDFNTTPPLIETFGIEDFPSVSLLIRGTIINVVESVGLLQTRNQMTYSDGQGIQVSISDKTPMLMNWLNLFISQYEQKKLRLRKALNLRGALNGSGLSSEYKFLDGYWDIF